MIAVFMASTVAWMWSRKGITCSDWHLLPNGDLATVRPTEVGRSVGTVEIDDLAPGMIYDRGVDLFDRVNKACFNAR
jgi:hypothetical protein